MTSEAGGFLESSEPTGTGDSGTDLERRLLREEDTFSARLRARFDRMDNSPAARLRVVLEELAADYQVGTWIELWVRARLDEGTRDLRQRIDDEFRALIEGIVDDGQRSGAFAGPVPGDTALIMAAIVDGFTIQATLHDAKVNPGYMMSAFVDVAELLLECELPAVPREARRDD